MKYCSVLPFAAVLVIISLTSRADAFDTFRLVADTAEVDGALQQGSVQHDKMYYGVS